MDPELSIVAPAFDEEENLEPLYERVRASLDGLLTWELVLVDDGSRDDSAAVIRRLVERDSRVRGVLLERNSGQTAATFAGIRVASGGIIATIDADLQNDPADLPGMVRLLGDADSVVGYRVDRQDTFVRRASSRIANAVRNRVSGDVVRDTGCSLKVFRAPAIRSVPVFEGMHRFLPTLLRQRGYRVLEFPVHHHPRRAGRSKYGISNRALRASVDLLAVRWMKSRLVDGAVKEVVER